MEVCTGVQEQDGRVQPARVDQRQPLFQLVFFLQLGAREKRKIASLSQSHALAKIGDAKSEMKRVGVFKRDRLCRIDGGTIMKSLMVFGKVFLYD